MSNLRWRKCRPDSAAEKNKPKVDTSLFATRSGAGAVLIAPLKKTKPIVDTSVFATCCGAGAVLKRLEGRSQGTFALAAASTFVPGIGRVAEQSPREALPSQVVGEGVGSATTDFNHGEIKPERCIGSSPSSAAKPL